MSKLSCDIKFMYRASTGHKFILIVADEVTNYLVATPCIEERHTKLEKHL